MRTLALALAGSFLVGCGGLGEVGSFGERGFEHARYRYAVLAGADGRILPDEWELDNFQLVDGKPAKPKKTGEYQMRIGFDHDGDGDVDVRQDLYRYDLRFRNLRNRAEIWLQTIPLSQNRRQTELRVLMREYVDAVSGAGFVAVEYGGHTTIAADQRFATRIVGTDEMTVQGLEAHAATVEIANVDQLHLSAESRWERARVVMIRTPFTHSTSGSGRVSGSTRRGGRRAPPSPDYPVLMLVGYSSLPEDFESELPAFERFVESIRFLHSTAAPGVIVQHSPQEEATPEDDGPPEVDPSPPPEPPGDDSTGEAPSEEPAGSEPAAEAGEPAL